MNNEEFRDLVLSGKKGGGVGGGGSGALGGGRGSNRQHASNNRKTTKEIAREAVEAEFRSKSRKKKRRRGGGGGSSSDEDEESRDGRERKDQKDDEDEDHDDVADEDGELRSDGKNLEEGEDGKGPTKQHHKPKKKQPKYRDRARERREGKNVDYQETDQVLQAGESKEGDTTKATEMTKYLGGDEEHTHLVKGLDLALAQKVRREEMKSHAPQDFQDAADAQHQQHFKTSGMNNAVEMARAKLQKSYGRRILDMSSDQFHSLLQTWHHSRNDSLTSSKSSLASSMCLYLVRLAEKQNQLPTQSTDQNHRQPITPAGRTLQRSTLTFSLAPIHAPETAWQIPRESTRSSSLPSDSLRSHNGSSHFRGLTSLEPNLIDRIKVALKGNTTRVVQRESEDDTTTGTRKKKRKQPKQDQGKDDTPEHDGKAEAMDLEEEDIFADTGPYIPPSAA